MNQVSDALIGAIAALVVCLINNFFQDRRRKKDEQDKEVAKAAKEAKEKAELNSRLEGIENKLDTHNGYAEKIGGMAIDIAVIKNDIKNIKERGDKVS